MREEILCVSPFSRLQALLNLFYRHKPPPLKTGLNQKSFWPRGCSNHNMRMLDPPVPRESYALDHDATESKLVFFSGALGNSITAKDNYNNNYYLGDFLQGNIFFKSRLHSKIFTIICNQNGLTL